MDNNEPNKAKQNWSKLKNVVMAKGKLKADPKPSKYHLFHKQEQEVQQSIIVTYAADDMEIKINTPQINLKSLIKFQGEIDSTGKWVWQGEEIAAYYLLKKWEKYATKNQKIQILELGAGSSGIAGICISKMLIEKNKSQEVELLLTDGQEENIQFLQENLKQNGLQNQKSELLIWGSDQMTKNISLKEGRKYFNLIIISDCLYFENYHQELALTLKSLMNETSIALFVNPSRGNSMKNFLSFSKGEGFDATFVSFDDKKFQEQFAKVQKMNEFDKEKDQFYFFELKKI